MKSLLYASVSTLAADEEEEEVARIVAVSTRRNEQLGVTGTLVLARGHFAQILEGTQAAVDTLMESIARDSRHRQVTIVNVATITRPNFPGWSFAYSGASHYVEKHVRPLIDGPDPLAARQLRHLLQALAETV